MTRYRPDQCAHIVPAPSRRSDREHVTVTLTAVCPCGRIFDVTRTDYHTAQLAFDAEVTAHILATI